MSYFPTPLISTCLTLKSQPFENLVLDVVQHIETAKRIPSRYPATILRLLRSVVNSRFVYHLGKHQIIILDSDMFYHNSDARCPRK